MKLPTVPAVFICWFLFALAGVAGLVTGLLALPFKRGYTSNLVHAQDCAAAAFLGWSGDNTVSKECGRELAAGAPCRFCRVLCRVLDKLLETDHCRKEIQR